VGKGGKRRNGNRILPLGYWLEVGGAMKFQVFQFYVVEVEVEAEDAAHAKEVAGCHETEYEIVTRFKNQEGGPEVERADIDDEVFEVDEEGYTVIIKEMP
jgi:hypothetical protein